MFKKIEEGLEKYKKIVKDYLKICKGMDDERAGYEDLASKYAGSVNWPTVACEWKKKTEARMEGMEDALGLTDDQIYDITKKTKEELGILNH